MLDSSKISDSVKATDEIKAVVQRGPESWNFIYVVLGFTLAIECTVISMFEPLKFPLNIFILAVVVILTVWVFLFSGRFQNKLLGLKNSYENKFR